MEPVRPNTEKEALERRPSASPEDIREEIAEYQRLQSDFFSTPRLRIREASLEKSGLASAPPQNGSRLEELYFRLFRLDERVRSSP